MHQDVLTSRFHHDYDGAPLWLVNKTQPRHPFPWPYKKITSWSEGYSTEAIGQCFQVNKKEIFSNIYNHWFGAFAIHRFCVFHEGISVDNTCGRCLLISASFFPFSLVLPSTGYLQKCPWWTWRVVDILADSRRAFQVSAVRFGLRAH